MHFLVWNPRIAEKALTPVAQTKAEILSDGTMPAREFLITKHLFALILGLAAHSVVATVYKFVL